MSAPWRYESHCHTTLCKHAYGTPDAYAAVAIARGFKGISELLHRSPTPERAHPTGARLAAVRAHPDGLWAISR